MQREAVVKSHNIIWKKLVRMILKENRSLLQATRSVETDRYDRSQSNEMITIKRR